MCPQSSDRVVQCIGKTNECMDAISDILVLIKEVPIKGSIQNYDPINYDDYLADKYGGFGGDNAGNGGGRNNNNRGGGGGGGNGGGGLGGGGGGGGGGQGGQGNEFYNYFSFDSIKTINFMLNHRSQ